MKKKNTKKTTKSEPSVNPKNLVMPKTTPPLRWQALGMGRFDPSLEENIQGKEGFERLPGDKMIGHNSAVRYYLPDKNLLLLGPSGSICKYDKKYLELKREEGFKILAFSSSPLWYLYDIGVTPDFVSFFDPNAVCQALLESSTGQRISDLELQSKLKWCNNITLLGYNCLTFGDLLKTNEYLHGSARHGYSSFLGNSDFVKFYASHNLYDIFGYCICRNPIVVSHDALGTCLNATSQGEAWARFNDNLLYVTRNGYDTRELQTLTCATRWLLTNSALQCVLSWVRVIIT